MNRREFLTGLGGAAATWPLGASAQQQPAAPTSQQTPAASSSVREDWLQRRNEPILDPELPIIDPHHHLWDRPGRSRYLLDELLRDTNSGHNILATVFVQCGSMYREKGPAEMRPVGETEFVNGIAAMSASGTYGKTRACAGIVGYADLTLGSRVEPVLSALVRAGGDRFRGVRYITTWDADVSPRGRAGLLADKTFREGFAVLGRLGLSFDAWLYHTQIDEVADLAGAFPDTKIVLDHVGGPLGVGAYAGKRDEVFSRWAASIKALARHQNVSVKISGLGESFNGFGLNELPDPPSSETVAATFRPYVETAIEAFGPSRAMFESNFPVDKVSFSYPVWWNACKLMTRGASAAERADLFAGTAARFYRLDVLS